MSDMSQEAIARFVVFCLEAYKQRHQLTGAEAADLFARYGVTAYLQEGCDVLHSLGESALMDDLDDYLKRRKNQRS